MTWLKSNRWYLVAVAVLLPAAFLVALNAGWWRYLESVNGNPTAVHGSETVEYADAQWSLLEWRAFDADTDAGSEAGLLPGTSLVTATIGVRPGQEPPTCAFTLVSGDRRWDEASFTDADFEIADDAEDYCDSEATEPYKVQTFFVVPDDAVAELTLQLRNGYVGSDLLAFEL